MSNLSMGNLNLSMNFKVCYNRRGDASAKSITEKRPLLIRRGDASA